MVKMLSFIVSKSYNISLPQQFLTTVTSFIVIDSYSTVPLTTIITVLYTKLEESPLFSAIARMVVFLYFKKKYSIIDDILTT